MAFVIGRAYKTTRLVNTIIARRPTLTAGRPRRNRPHAVVARVIVGVAVQTLSNVHQGSALGSHVADKARVGKIDFGVGNGGRLRKRNERFVCEFQKVLCKNAVMCESCHARTHSVDSFSRNTH